MLLNENLIEELLKSLIGMNKESGIELCKESENRDERIRKNIIEFFLAHPDGIIDFG